MRCTYCQTEGADCLTADRVRTCESCLYEQTAAERDALRAELARLKGLPLPAPVLVLDQEAEVRRKVAAAYEGGFRGGVEAMRAAAANVVKHLSNEDGLGMGSQRIEGAILAMTAPTTETF